MLRRSPPSLFPTGEERFLVSGKADQMREEDMVSGGEEEEEEEEDGVEHVGGSERRREGVNRPLLAYRSTAQESSELSPLVTPRSGRRGYGINGHIGIDGGRIIEENDLEGQKAPTVKSWVRRKVDEIRGKGKIVVKSWNPKTWDRGTVYRNLVVAPVACLPAVVVGLLLNILDALSYGMILFPLGSPIFAGLGSAGISIFYVSTIISQLTFSTGSIFRGGVGSELVSDIYSRLNFCAGLKLTLCDRLRSCPFFTTWRPRLRI